MRLAHSALTENIGILFQILSRLENYINVINKGRYLVSKSEKFFKKLLTNPKTIHILM